MAMQPPLLHPGPGASFLVSNQPYPLTISQNFSVANSQATPQVFYIQMPEIIQSVPEIGSSMPMTWDDPIWTQKSKNLCDIIHGMAQKEWYFEWLNNLREWKAVHEHEDLDAQVHLMPNRSADTIGHLRIKLATLQTQMVWSP